MPQGEGMLYVEAGVLGSRRIKKPERECGVCGVR
jgi:hypothetical protein